MRIDKIEQMFYNIQTRQYKFSLEVLMNASQSIRSSFSKSFTQLKSQKGVMYIIIFILALAAFEAFNFSTTDHALSDVLGDLRFFGIRWATLLSLAFCGIDFAGIARLFGPQTRDENKESAWFMFSAWILAGTMNAILTWWGVVMAMQTHDILSVELVNGTFIGKAIPIFIALIVWLIRILLIGTLTKKSEHLRREKPVINKQELSRRELRQAQSRAAHPAASIRSVPAGFNKSSVSARTNSEKHGSRQEPQYFPIQNEENYRTLNASGNAFQSGRR